MAAILEACSLAITSLGSSASSCSLSSALGELARCFSLENDASWLLLSDSALDPSQREAT